MPRKPKGTGAPLFVEIQSGEIPQWMSKVQPPEGEDLRHLLNEAVIQPGIVSEGPFARFFVALLKEGQRAAEQAAEREEPEPSKLQGDTARTLVALQLLHLVPAYIDLLYWSPATWLREAINRVFRWRRYDLFTKIRKGRGRPKSEEYTAAMLKFGAEADRALSSAAVANLVSRAKVAAKKREKRINETWDRTGATRALRAWVTQSDGKRQRTDSSTIGRRRKTRSGRED